MVKRLNELKDLGTSNKDIAKQLGLSEQQIAYKLRNMKRYTKVG